MSEILGEPLLGLIHYGNPILLRTGQPALDMGGFHSDYQHDQQSTLYSKFYYNLPTGTYLTQPCGISDGSDDINHCNTASSRLVFIGVRHCDITPLNLGVGAYCDQHKDWYPTRIYLPDWNRIILGFSLILNILPSLPILVSIWQSSWIEPISKSGEDLLVSLQSFTLPRSSSSPGSNQTRHHHQFNSQPGKQAPC